jgi:hypothetical protein
MDRDGSHSLRLRDRDAVEFTARYCICGNVCLASQLGVLYGHWLTASSWERSPDGSARAARVTAGMAALTDEPPSACDRQAEPLEPPANSASRVLRQRTGGVAGELRRKLDMPQDDWWFVSTTPRVGDMTKASSCARGHRSCHSRVAVLMLRPDTLGHLPRVGVAR